VAVGASVSAEQGRKFGMEASLMTSLKLAVVAVPPPTALMTFLSRSFED